MTLLSSLAFLSRVSRAVPLGVLGVLAVAIFGSALAAEPPPFTWPPTVVYDGQVRDPKWLEATYRAQAGRIVQANATFYHLDDPQRLQLRDGQQPTHVLAKVVKVLSDGLLLTDLEAGGSAIAADRHNLGFAIGAECLLIRLPTADGRRPPASDIVEWTALKVEPRPVTRAQFLLAIRSGLQITFTRDCPECQGKGYRVGSEVVYDGARLLKMPAKKTACDRCKGAGHLPIRTFNR